MAYGYQPNSTDITNDFYPSGGVSLPTLAPWPPGAAGAMGSGYAPIPGSVASGAVPAQQAPQQPMTMASTDASMTPRAAPPVPPRPQPAAMPTGIGAPSALPYFASGVLGSVSPGAYPGFRPRGVGPGSSVPIFTYPRSQAATGAPVTPSPPLVNAPLPPVRPPGLGTGSQAAQTPGSAQATGGVAHVSGPDWLKHFFLAGMPATGMTAMIRDRAP